MLKYLIKIATLIAIIVSIFSIDLYATDNYVAKTWIDSPTEKKVVNYELEIEGWVMTTDAQSEIKIYIDGKEHKIKSLERKNRGDVLRTVTGYGNSSQNPKPGYVAKIDLSDIEDGEHTLEVAVISRNGKKLTSDSRKITLKKYIANTYIDLPAGTTEYIVKDELTVEGWVMSNDNNYQIKAYINGKEQEIKSIQRKKRADVIRAITGYGNTVQNETPGYTLKIDTSNIISGKYDLEIRIISTNGEILKTATKKLTIQRYTAKSYIDLPITNEKIGPEYTIRGWIMTDDENSQINVYIDNQKQKIKQITRKERADVIKAIKGYGGIEKNPNPGFGITLEQPNISDGKHTLKIETVSREGIVISTSTVTINYENYKAKTWIDSVTTYKHTLNIEGWIMSEDINSKVKVYIDGKEQQIQNIERKQRGDVIRAVNNEYGGIEKNPKPGFTAQIDITNITDGKHTLKFNVISDVGRTMATKTMTINIQKYTIGIDVSNHNGTINWAKVKQSEIDFAIIRAGFRGYGDEGTLNQDPKFVENMKGAISNNINIGIYFYSQAITVQEAIEEADYTINILRVNGFQDSLTYPIIIDTERSGGRADSLTKEERTEIIKAFCNRIIEYGYTPMIYANKSWLENNLNMNELTKFDVWLAHYTYTNDPINNPSDYNGDYEMWQYTDKGNINGISTNVDINICYKKYN